MADFFPPPRRWFRFSLRTILISVVVVAIPLAWIAKERRQSAYEQQMAAELRQYNLMAVFGGPFDAYDDYPGPQGWWRGLAGAILGERILWVGSDETSGKTADRCELSPLTRLSNIQSLLLWNTNVSDLTPLNGLTKLKSVVVYKSRITKEQGEDLQRALPNCQVRLRH